MVHGTLKDWVDELSALAENHGLKPLPTEFYLVSDEDIYTLSSYYAPGRYRHWTHGERYWLAKQRDERGLGRIYELVVNGDPSLAYLLNKNPDAYNVLVVAHVLGHTDFFARNHALSQVRRPNVGLWFKEHADWMESLHQTRSFERMEKLVDAAHTLAQLVDPHYRSPEQILGTNQEEVKPRSFDWVQELYEPHAPPVDDHPQYAPSVTVWPSTRDILAVVSEMGHLPPEEKSALKMIRDEMLYFHPQGLTKYMNEGWATFWHVRLLRDFSNWDQSDNIEAIRMHALVTQSHHFLNPYYFGWTLWEMIHDMNGLQSAFDMVSDLTDQEWLNQVLSPDLVREAQDRHLWPEIRPINPDDPSEGTEPYPTDELIENIQRAFQPKTPEIFVEAIDVQGHRLELRYHESKPLHKHYTQDVLNAVAYLWGGEVLLVGPDTTWYGNADDWKGRA